MKKADVLAFFGGCMNTAYALGIDHSSVSKWGEDIPRSRISHVELAMQAEEIRREKRSLSKSQNLAMQAEQIKKAKEVAKKSRRKSRDVQESDPCKAQ